ncbi:mannosyltransferase-like protein [Leptomonas pyrrhocoris]|uniref:Mannosyltransferase-like protein n=1 Tax=Leptomonas pyrrhocoris TaxID=157538 RepID=A0A0M9FSK7_LEPPY|nr:mannosyltransferase-like protein [Leptomonas pyrrhocoris]KPA75006.1 mannosyltransferase-like protein [Leptomonas pyrrhocoris]|eukprot:XP_015653445.1 mannosyltransferase-like protein [Leptomonas pyrrhocoris]
MRPISRKTVHFIKHSSVVSVSVSRSLSELSNIPPNWIKPLRESRDQVWATADFFATIYRRNGIDPAKIRVVPEAVDVYDFDPANYEREPITIPPGDTASFDSLPDLAPEERLRRYVFLSNFKWEARKGWDVLLGAYWDAFGPHAPPELRGRTTLVIKTEIKRQYAAGVGCPNFMRFLESWGMKGHLHGMRGVEDFPHVVVLCTSMSAVQLTQLYGSADAFVFPSKAEGWGLPANTTAVARRRRPQQRIQQPRVEATAGTGKVGLIGDYGREMRRDSGAVPHSQLCLAGAPRLPHAASLEPREQRMHSPSVRVAEREKGREEALDYRAAAPRRKVVPQHRHAAAAPHLPVRVHLLHPQRQRPPPAVRRAST